MKVAYVYWKIGGHTGMLHRFSCTHRFVESKNIINILVFPKLAVLNLKIALRHRKEYYDPTSVNTCKWSGPGYCMLHWYCYLLTEGSMQDFLDSWKNWLLSRVFTLKYSPRKRINVILKTNLSVFIYLHRPPHQAWGHCGNLGLYPGEQIILTLNHPPCKKGCDNMLMCAQFRLVFLCALNTRTHLIFK